MTQALKLLALCMTVMASSFGILKPLLNLINLLLPFCMASIRSRLQSLYSKNDSLRITKPNTRTMTDYQYAADINHYKVAPLRVLVTISLLSVRARLHTAPVARLSWFHCCLLLTRGAITTYLWRFYRDYLVFLHERLMFRPSQQSLSLHVSVSVSKYTIPRKTTLYSYTIKNTQYKLV